MVLKYLVKLILITLILKEKYSYVRRWIYKKYLLRHFDVKFQHYWFAFYYLHQYLPVELVEMILNLLDSMIYIKFDINTLNLSKIYLKKPIILFN